MHCIQVLYTMHDMCNCKISARPKNVISMENTNFLRTFKLCHMRTKYVTWEGKYCNPSLVSYLKLSCFHLWF